MSVPYSFLSGTWIDLGCNLSFEGSLVMKAGQEGCVPARPCSGTGAAPVTCTRASHSVRPGCLLAPPWAWRHLATCANEIPVQRLGTGPERLLGRFVLQLCLRPHWMARMGCSVIRNIDNLDQPRCRNGPAWSHGSVGWVPYCPQVISSAETY